ncbi:glycerate kinase [Pilimelia anulata]|uniref:Glycerate kinase n=1 Tax=Pilimelia anulata TaxID=53371 RepID=A0A8J3B8G9_9ACTN|nr:glycerate kinase [Pilimelia anulata]GGJ84885.1 glycerate kinase [Pilimelia anulata]
MRVLVCPDKFSGTLTAAAAAAAIAAGWAAARPGDAVAVAPLADGGPGFVDALAPAVGGRRLPVPTVDPLGRPVTGEILVTGATAYVESAHACGRHLLRYRERDPAAASTYGVGALLAAAVTAGARRVVVGLGGSGTHDVGAGLLAALGAGPRDAAGAPLPPGGAALAAAAALAGPPRLAGRPLAGIALVGAADVDNPLVGPAGAAAVYGPQKGLRRRDVPRFDAGAAHLAALLAAALPGCPPDLADRPGAGAAGGLGAALLALGGTLTPGAALVRERLGLTARIAAADLVLTGEGSADAQTGRGKVVADVAAVARAHGVPCVVLAGRAGVSAADLGVSAVHSLTERLGSARRARAGARAGLTALAGEVALRWAGVGNAPAGG